MIHHGFKAVVSLVHLHDGLEQSLDFLLSTISFVLQHIETDIDHIKPLDRVLCGSLKVGDLALQGSLSGLSFSSNSSSLRGNSVLSFLWCNLARKLGSDTTCHAPRTSSPRSFLNTKGRARSDGMVQIQHETDCFLDCPMDAGDVLGLLVGADGVQDSLECAAHD
ncbi:hypothetical protein V6N13_107611 [Hibiscus sabdariffa]